MAGIRLLKATRVTGIILLGLVMVVVTLVMLRPVREAVLGQVIERVGQALPGKLVVEEAGWPKLGEIWFRHIHWSDGGTSLAEVSVFAVAVDTGALFNRDLEVDSVAVDVTWLDLPAILERFSSEDVGEKPKPGDSGDPFFPRPGSIPGIPSVQVKALGVDADSVRLSAGLAIHAVEIRGSVDLGKNTGPAIRLDRAKASSPEGGWELEETGIEFSANAVRGGAAGTLAPGWPVTLTLDGDVDGAYTVDLHAGETDPITVRATGRLHREEFRIHSIDVDASVQVPGVATLSGMPFLAKPLAKMPLFPGLESRFSGSVDLRPGFGAKGTLRIMESDWIGESRVVFDYRDQLLKADTVSIRHPEFTVDGSGSVGRELNATVAARITGLSWLSTLGVTGTLPETLDVAVSGTLDGTTASPGFRGAVTGAFQIGGFRLEDILVSASARSMKEAISVDYSVVSDSIRVSGAGDITLGSEVTAQLAPVVIQSLGDQSPRFQSDRKTRLGYNPQTQTLHVQKLRIRGSGGELDIDARLSNMSTGSFELAGRWPVFPTVLSRWLEASQVDSLRAAWSADAPFAVDISGNVTESSGDMVIAANGRLILPGPATLRSFAPQDARVRDLGPLRAAFHGSGRLRSGKPQEFALQLDAGETAWLDSASVQVRGGLDSVYVEEAVVSVEGLRIQVNGSTTGGVWDADANLTLLDPGLLNRLLPSLETQEASLEAIARFQGTPESPNLNAAVTGHLITREIHLPELRAEAEWSTSGASAEVQLPTGGSVGSLFVDSLTVNYRSAPGTANPFPGDLDLDLQGPQLNVLTSLNVNRKDGWSVRADTVGISVTEGNLASTNPFTVRLVDNPPAIVFDNLRMEGSLGTLFANGRAAEDGSDFQADISLFLPQNVPTGWLPEGLWPGQVDATIRTSGHEGVSAEISAAGLALGDEEDMAAVIRLTTQAETSELEIQVTGNTREYVNGLARFPGVLHLYPPRFTQQNEQLRADFLIDGLPVPWKHIIPGTSSNLMSVLEGKVALRGTGSRPAAYAGLRVRLPKDDTHPEYTIELEVDVLSDAASESSLFELRPQASRLPAAGEFNGLRAAARLVRIGEPILTADLKLPMSWEKSSGAPSKNSRTVDLSIVSDRLALNELNPYLPAKAAIQGTFDLRFTAKGPIEDPELSGYLAAKAVRGSLPDGSRASGDLRVEFGGSARKPKVKGDILVDSALFPIPDTPKSLHPVTGAPVLWSVEGFEPPPVDSVGVFRSARPDRLATGSSIEPDLEISVKVPSNMWLRGRGMEFELRGDLQLKYKDANPVLTGTLRATQGRLPFMGRTFTLRQGEVTFFGDGELNPSLGIRLTSKIKSYEIIVVISGTKDDPRLDLTSDPEMQQGDIMSVLLFGDTQDKLDGDQLEEVGRRAAAMAAVYGSAEIEGVVTGSLPVDILTYNPSGPDGSSTIVVGKYLSRKALLKYEQALESGVGFFVTLEYTLPANFRFDTLMGTRQSGAEVNWSHDW